MTQIVPFTANRHAIYDLLTRAKRFHCSVGATFEFDVTDLLAAIKTTRQQGRPVNLTACLVRATGMVLEKYPRFNHHMFHGLLRKYEAAFDEISCTLVMARRDEQGERILFPVVVRRSNEMTLDEVGAFIKEHRQTPIAELPQMAAFRKLEGYPRLLLRWISYKARSDHRFYLKYFGTYGLSSLVKRGWGGVAGHSLANTAAAFLPGTITERPVVRNGEVTVRTIMNMMVIVDHYILDGLDVVEGIGYLNRLLTKPEQLGLTLAESNESSS